MTDPIDLARSTFAEALERVLAAGDDAATMLEALVDGEDVLLEHDALDEEEREQAAADYEGLVEVALEAEDLAVRALSAVVHDENVAPHDRLVVAAEWIDGQADDEDVAGAAVGHVLYLNEADERMPLIIHAWQSVRCGW